MIGTYAEIKDQWRESERPLPTVWDAGKDAAPILPREWLLGVSYCRSYVTVIIATGGVGKTTLMINQAISMTCGRPLMGEYVHHRCRVLVITLEDSADELRRRVRAGLQHHGVGLADVEDHLFLCAAGRMALVVNEGGRYLPGPLALMIREYVARYGIDHIVLDPWVKTIETDENSNAEVDRLVSVLTELAAELHIAIAIAHHVAKGPPDPGNADRARGAGALVAAARLAWTLHEMTETEAEAFGVPASERRSLVRLGNAKANLAPKASQAKWFRLVSVALENGTDAYPGGDHVQAIERWEPPEAFDGLTGPTLHAILDQIDKGLPNGTLYSDAPKAADRAAWRVVVDHIPSKTEKQARDVIRVWVKNGVLQHETYTDPKRHEPAKGLRANPAKRPN